MKFFQHVSPIKIVDGQQHVSEECLQKKHLLDLLYCKVAAKLQDVEREIEDSKGGKENQEEIGCFKKAWKSIWDFLCFIIVVPIRFLIRILKSKAVKAAVTLPWQLIKILRLLKPKSEITNLVSTLDSICYKTFWGWCQIHSHKGWLEDYLLWQTLWSFLSSCGELGR